jgi:hypothetical protein
MHEFNIYTEDLNRKKIEKLVSSYFDGFTILESVGYWKGKREKAVIIRILSGAEDSAKVKALALKIKKQNKQQSVIIVKKNTDVNFV